MTPTAYVEEALAAPLWVINPYAGAVIPLLPKPGARWLVGNQLPVQLHAKGRTWGTAVRIIEGH